MRCVVSRSGRRADLGTQDEGHWGGEFWLGSERRYGEDERTEEKSKLLESIACVPVPPSTARSAFWNTRSPEVEPASRPPLSRRRTGSSRKSAPTLSCWS